MPIAYDNQMYEDEYALEAGRPIIEETTDSKGRTEPQKQPGTPVPSSENNAPAAFSEAPSGIPEGITRITVRPETEQPQPDYINPPEGSIVPKIAKGLEGLTKSVWEAMLAPGNALQGKVPMWAMDPETGEYHTSREVIEKTNDLAGLMVMGPAPVASKLAEGTLGSFAGVRSKTLNEAKYNQARMLEYAGKHPDEIWQQTGFFRAADGKWKYEIPNDMSNLKMSGTEIVGNEGIVRIKVPQWNDLDWDAPDAAKKWDAFLTQDGKGVPLKDVLHNPELFKAYPFLENVPVKHQVFTDGTRGAYHPSENAIYMNPAKPEQFLSTLQHEVQHAIQTHEGFAGGGNSRMFSSPELLNASAFFENAVKDKLKEFAQKNPNFENSLLQAAIDNKTSGAYYYFSDEIKENVNKLIQDAVKLGFNPKIVEAADKIGVVKAVNHQKYLRLMGEVESRNVQARLDFDNTDRFLRSPRSTESVPRFLQKDPAEPSTYK